MIRILVVDDDLAIREMLRIMLEYTGYEVLQASGGAEALEIIRSSPEPLVVLLDLMMPTLSGLDVLHDIEQHPHLARKHGYILITASREIETLASEPIVHRLGIPLISKPFDMNSMLDTVETVFRRLTKVAGKSAGMRSTIYC